MEVILSIALIAVFVAVVYGLLSIQRTIQARPSDAGAIVNPTPPIDVASLVASVRSAVEAEMRKTAQETLQVTSQQSAEFFAAQSATLEGKTRSMLAPFEEQIKGLSVSVNTLQTTYSQEQGAISQLATQITTLQSTTTTLTNSLKSPTARGSWGENQLRNVIQLAGMESYCDYTELFTGGEGESDQRPDVVVRLPNGAMIAIDSKAPLSAYLRMQDATNVPTKEIELKHHAKLMRDHIKNFQTRNTGTSFHSLQTLL